MKLEVRELTLSDAQKKVRQDDAFFLFYSTFLGGYTRDRLLMSVPIDDHIVHRGDGVFDNTLCINGNYYLLDQHIERFFYSANSIGIRPEFSESDLKQLLIRLGLAAGKSAFIARYFLSRGHGSMSVYPHEAIAPNLYVLIGRSSSPPEYYFKKGMTVITSPVGMRPPISPQVKSVDYLSNALMELAARNSGADTAIAIDQSGNLTEGSNKNVVVITDDRVMMIPPSDKILRGTTLNRAIELAAEHMKKRLLRETRTASIPLTEAYNAREILFFSTTLPVAPVVKYDGRIIGDGKPGEIWKSFYTLFQKDMRLNSKYLTSLKKG
ncbi:MAG TPA: aminotransferase class IV [Candidatus Kryptonia bacterium]